MGNLDDDLFVIVGFNLNFNSYEGCIFIREILGNICIRSTFSGNARQKCPPEIFWEEKSFLSVLAVFMRSRALLSIPLSYEELQASCCQLEANDRCL